MKSKLSVIVFCLPMRVVWFTKEHANKVTYIVINPSPRWRCSQKTVANVPAKILLVPLPETEMTLSRTIHAAVIMHRSLIGAPKKQERRRRDSRRANQFAIRFGAHSIHLWMHGT